MTTLTSRALDQVAGRGLPGSALVGPDEFRDREDLAPEGPLQRGGHGPR